MYVQTFNTTEVGVHVKKITSILYTDGQTDGQTG